MTAGPKQATYDYVIVGAGSAGCTLAGRLTEDPGARVLLLEAGGWDRDPWIRIPLGWGQIIKRRLHDWMYCTEPEATLDERAATYPRGRVIGGSSSINAMAYVRGHRSDYDGWAAEGLTRWSYDHVLPYFRKQESWERGADAWRGGEGPLVTRTARYDDPLVGAWLEAGQAAGYAATPDYNGAQQEGFGRMQSTIRQGRRCSAAAAYLRPALGRPNLTVRTGVLVTSLVLDGARAVGVRYRLRGESVTANAAREVILAAGAINSPQLLMLSGIGDPERLVQHGIRVNVPLPGVGRNLQDHVCVGVQYRRRGHGPFVQHMRMDRMARALAQAYVFGTGFATDLPSGWTAFVKTAPEQPVPDIQLLFRAGPIHAQPYGPFSRPPFDDGFMCIAVLLRPESRGSLTLQSADPAKAPRIALNLMSRAPDWRTLRAGVRLVQRVGRQAPLRDFAEQELAPGPDASDEQVDAHIRATAATVHHPLGTCRMGTDGDPLAVVDPELRVRGVEGLRVVDASVMPRLVGGNINGPVIMIAEKAADLLRGREPLAPATAAT